MSKAAARALEAAARREKVAAYRESGATFTEIAQIIGVDITQVRGMYARYLQIQDEAAYGLSTRSRGIVEQCGYSVEALLTRLARGEAVVETILRRRVNCQRPQVEEIIAWLRRQQSGETFEKALIVRAEHRR